MAVDVTHFNMWVQQDLISIFEALVEFYLEDILAFSANKILPSWTRGQWAKPNVKCIITDCGKDPDGKVWKTVMGDLI